MREVLRRPPGRVALAAASDSSGAEGKARVGWLIETGKEDDWGGKEGTRGKK